jgi:urease accessory protein
LQQSRSFGNWSRFGPDKLRYKEADVTKIARFLAIGLALFVVPSQALAHDGHDAVGLLSGFVHPGFDHVLVMLAVGVWASQLGARLTVPLAFAGVLIAGSVSGALGLAVPAVEPMIGVSVIALGLATALSLRMPQAAAMVLVSLFAFFHGVAHGTEMPAMESGWGYGLGFVAASLALHGAGVGLGSLGQRLIRPAGVLTAAAGATLMLVA